MRLDKAVVAGASDAPGTLGSADAQGVGETSARTEMHLPHGYTNTSVREGAVVTKRYREPGAAERLGREATALRVFAGHLPVPALLAVDAAQGVLQTAF